MSEEKRQPQRKIGKGAPAKGRATRPLAPTEEDYIKSLEHASEDEGVLEAVGFYLDDELYAVDIDYVEEAIKPKEIAPLPRMPDFIEGVMSLRGEMLMVMDLRKRLGLPATTVESERIVVVSLKDIKCGLKVDRMSARMLLPGKLKPPRGEKEDRPFLSGMTKRQEEEVSLLDIEALLSFSQEAGSV